MKAFFLISVAAGLVLTGCSQSSSSTSPSATNSAQASSSQAGNAVANSASTTPNYGGVLGQAKNYSINQIDLAQLKQAIQEYNAAEGHYPKDLQALIPNYLAKIPKAPAGYQISYDPASGTVKVVRQQ